MTSRNKPKRTLSDQPDGRSSRRVALVGESVSPEGIPLQRDLIVIAQPTAQLRATDGVELFSAEVRPGASEAQIAAAEAELGVALPAAMRAFYAECNGLFLEWGLVGSERRELTPVFSYPDYGQPVGCINLLPVDQAMSAGWEADCHVNEIQDDHWISLYGAVPEPDHHHGFTPSTTTTDSRCQST